MLLSLPGIKAIVDLDDRGSVLLSSSGFAWPFFFVGTCCKFYLVLNGLLMVYHRRSIDSFLE